MKLKHHMPALRALTLALTLLCGWAAQAQTVIYGNLIYHDDWQSGAEKYGYYAINTADGSVTAVSPTDSYFYNGNGGAIVTSDGTVHMVNRDSQYGTVYITYYRYDFNTWETPAGFDRYGRDLDDYLLVANDLAEDPVTGKIYGCFANAANTAYNLGVVDFNTCTRTTIANYGVTPVLALAFDARGNLFGVKKNGYLYRIDKDGGEQTEVGDLGFSLSELPQSMTFDYATGKLYLAAQLQDFSSALYEINPLTAEAELICEFPKGEEFTGLYIPAPAVAEGAPAAVADLEANFPKGTLTGTASFTMPTQTEDGQTLTGDLSYTLRVNGDEIVREGTAQAGAKVQENLSLKQGLTTIAVVASNASGESPRQSITFWAGHDTPYAPTEVTLEISEAGQASLSWQAPGEQGVNGGYVSSEDLAYNIVRLPDNVAVATALKATSFVEQLPAVGYAEFRYVVEAEANGLKSETASSNAVKYGEAYQVPYTATFDTKDDFDVFTVLNLDGGNFKWIWYEKEDDGGVAICPNTEVTADDYLITPPIFLEGGKDYTFSIDYRAYSNTYPERMEILWGTSNDPTTTQLQTLLPPTDVTSNRYTTFQTVVRPEADGAYYFAIHDISSPNAMYLQVDNISVVEGANVSELVNAITATDFSDVTTLMGGEANATLTVTNVGTAKVENLSYVVSSADGGSEAEVTIDVPSQPTYGNSVQISVPLKASATPSLAQRFVTISKVNGADNDVQTASRTAQGRLFTLKESATRRSVVEEFTGAWCGNCTRGIAGLARMQRDYEDFIGIAVHGDDPMEIAPYRPIINLDLIPGYPYALVNRAIGCDPFFGNNDYSGGEELTFGLGRVWEAQQKLLTEASVKLSEAKIEGNTVNISTDVTFQYSAETGDYALAYVLLCDSVCRPADKTSQQDLVDWAQVNYLSGNSNFADDPDLGPWVAAAYRVPNYAYNHVAVAASDVEQGIGGSISFPLVCGQQQNHTYSFGLTQVPLAQHPDKLSVVAMLLNTRTGRIVNADEVHVTGATGISDITTQRAATLESYDLQGRRISNARSGIVIEKKTDGTTRKVLR